MTNLYVIGDIHGEYDLFKELVQKIFNHPKYSLENSVIVTVGDYIDRGPDSRKVIDYCITLQNTCNFVPLMGNHEDMLLNDRQSFILNGGVATLKSYGYEGQFDPEVMNNLGRDPEVLFGKKHWYFFNNLDLYYEIGNVAIAHAGIDHYDKTAGEHNRNMLLWSRRLRMDKHNYYSYTVHGHTPMKEAIIGEYVAYIDTGAVFGGSLTCLFIPDVDNPKPANMEKIQVKKLKVIERKTTND